MESTKKTWILWLALPQFILLVVTACISLCGDNFYHLETRNWQVQSIGQDMVDLFLVAPVLLASAWYASRGSKLHVTIWAATNIYLLYTYVIFCFSVHFNPLFYGYCLILGLTFYSLIGFCISELTFMRTGNTLPTKGMALTVGVYFLFVAIAFYALWMMEIIPFMMKSQAPDVLVETGLFTNPVHALDLSIVLPGIFVTGVLMVKRKPLGVSLAKIGLIFFVLMNITIGFLMVLMGRYGFPFNIGLASVMFVLAAFSLVLFMWMARHENSISRYPQSNFAF